MSVLVRRSYTIYPSLTTYTKIYKSSYIYQRELSLLEVTKNVQYTIKPLLIEDNKIVFSNKGFPLRKMLPYLTKEDLLSVLYRVLYSIRDMSLNNFRHRDLHLDNILIKRCNYHLVNHDNIYIPVNWEVTIIDFDQSCTDNMDTIVVRGKGLQSNLMYTSYNDKGRHDVMTFTVKLLLLCQYEHIRYIIIHIILGKQFIDKTLSTLYNIDYKTSSITYKDLYKRDFRFLNTTLINNVDTIVHRLNSYYG